MAAAFPSQSVRMQQQGGSINEGVPGVVPTFSGIVDAHLVYPGDALDHLIAHNNAASSCLKGHGVAAVRSNAAGENDNATSESLVATTLGVLEVVNRLVSVRPLHARYSPQVGDVVVGRVMAISGRRWQIDIGARRDASMQLSAVTLPDGERRRRTRDDQNAMRAAFAEGDLVCCEVQAAHRDGGVALHARGTRYGKLAGGATVYVHPSVLKRSRHPFCELDADLGIGCVVGYNGVVWCGRLPNLQDVAPADDGDDDDNAGGVGGDDNDEPRGDDMEVEEAKSTPAERRALAEGVARAAASVDVLRRLGLPVHPQAVIATRKLADEVNADLRAMADASFARLVLEREAERRNPNANDDDNM